MKYTVVIERTPTTMRPTCTPSPGAARHRLPAGEGLAAERGNPGDAQHGVARHRFSEEESRSGARTDGMGLTEIIAQGDDD